MGEELGRAGTPGPTAAAWCRRLARGAAWLLGAASLVWLLRDWPWRRSPVDSSPPAEATARSTGGSPVPVRRSGGRRRGVLFVHGVGGQTQSSTLLGFGGSLLDWIERWYRVHDPTGRQPRVMEARLGFAPADDGETPHRSWAIVELPTAAGEETWVCAEAWWGASSQRPGFAFIFAWTVRHYAATIGRVLDLTLYEITRLLRPDDETVGRPWWQSIGIAVWALLGALLGLLPYGLLLPRLFAARLDQADQALAAGQRQIKQAVIWAWRQGCSLWLLAALLTVVYSLLWSSLALLRVPVGGTRLVVAGVGWLGERLETGLDGLFRPGAPNRTGLSGGGRLVSAVYGLGVLATYAVVALAGYIVLAPLVLVARIPFTPLQDFVQLRLIQPFLQINAGEFHAYLADPIQAANLERRVAEGIRWLAEEQACEEITVISYSGGVVITLGLLAGSGDQLRGRADPAVDLRRHVTKLLTLGAGLNKAWPIMPQLERLRRPLPDHMHWVDFWSTYDVVPVGWLRPPCDATGFVPIFAPSPGVVADQHLGAPRPNPYPYYLPEHDAERLPKPLGCPEVAGDGVARHWPISEQVVNQMSVLADHGGYWANDEQVLGRLAAEIDAWFYQDSRFWRGDAPAPAQADDAAAVAARRGRPLKYTEARLRAVRRRQERVSVLAFWRGMAVLAAGVGIAWLGLDLAATGHLWAWPEGGPAVRPPVDWAFMPWRVLAADMRAGQSPWLLGAMTIVVAAWVAYDLLRWCWIGWDARARQAAMDEIASPSASAPKPVGRRGSGP